MRVSQLPLLLMALGSAEAFAPTVTRQQHHSVVFMSDDEESTQVDAPAAPTYTPSGMKMSEVRTTIDNLTKDNFSDSIAKIEPFLLNDAGATFYGKSMRRIARNAKAIGVEVPSDYALEAKATYSRRMKQDEFIKVKEAEAAEATPEVEEESPAEEEAATEDLEPAEA